MLHGGGPVAPIVRSNSDGHYDFKGVLELGELTTTTAAATTAATTAATKKW